MRYFILLLMAIVLSFSGGTITATAEDFLDTCPKELAYIYQEAGEYSMYWKIAEGDVSKIYNEMGKEEFERQAKARGLEYDFDQCPPINGHLRSRHGLFFNLPMGFFDDEANYLNQAEFEEHQKAIQEKQKREKSPLSASR